MKKYVFLLLLFGCTPQPTPEQLAANEIAQCTDLGFKPKSEAFGNCRLKIREMTESKKSAEDAAIIGAYRPYHAVSCNTIGTNTTCY